MQPLVNRPPALSDANSFLPEDYLERRAERRTNFLSIALFVVVTMGVVGAFFVTNRQWNDVKRYQQAVNVRYTQAAKDIEQLKVLEAQKSELLERAEVTTALIEKVPRSILLAELVNRMPAKMTLLSIDVNSTRLDKPVKIYARKDADPKDPRKSISAGPGKADAKSLAAAKNAKAEAEKPVATAPRFDTRMILVGVAASHNEVAKYVSNLQECALLTGVDLNYSESTTIEARTMNKFRIEADLKTEADARRIQPMHTPRLQDVASAMGADPKAKPASNGPGANVGEWMNNPELPRPPSETTPGGSAKPDEQE